MTETVNTIGHKEKTMRVILKIELVSGEIIEKEATDIVSAKEGASTIVNHGVAYTDDEGNIWYYPSSQIKRVLLPKQNTTEESKNKLSEKEWRDIQKAAKGLADLER